MPARAAGEEEDALRSLQGGGGLAQLLEVDVPLLEVDPAEQGVARRPRLLVDLLQHEMAVTALLGLDRIPGDPLGLLGPGGAPAVGHHHRSRGHRDHVAVVQEEEVPGVGKEGAYVGGEEVLPLAEAHHQGRTPPRPHELLGLVLVEKDDRVDPPELPDCLAHRLFERAVVVVGDQVGDDLGVGLGGEAMTLGLEARLQLQVVLDDAVVDHHDLPLAVLVGVGVLLGGPAVGGPARVTEAVGAVEGLRPQGVLEVLELARGPPAEEHSVPDDRHPGRVVAPILQAPQPLHDHGHRVPRPHVPDDSAHAAGAAYSCFLPCAWRRFSAQPGLTT